MTTPVIFRKWRDNGDVIAILPTIPADERDYICESYIHVGGHGGCNYIKLLKTTLLANPEEYKELKQELEKIGYTNLKVYRRMQPSFTNERREEIASWRIPT